MKKETALRACKIAGLKSTSDLATLEGVTVATILNWFNKDRELFDAALKRALDKRG